MPKTLHLSLKKQPFDVMVTGEKVKEFRKPSKWLISRFYEKDGTTLKEYDLIKFTNGYGNDKPYFICRFDGFIKLFWGVRTIGYSNGLFLDDITAGDFVIFCGEIIEKGNIKKA